MQTELDRLDRAERAQHQQMNIEYLTEHETTLREGIGRLEARLGELA